VFGIVAGSAATVISQLNAHKEVAKLNNFYQMAYLVCSI
jgi:hypothetical protein